MTEQSSGHEFQHIFMLDDLVENLQTLSTALSSDAQGPEYSLVRIQREESNMQEFATLQLAWDVNKNRETEVENKGADADEFRPRDSERFKSDSKSRSILRGSFLGYLGNCWQSLLYWGTHKRKQRNVHVFEG